MTRKRFYIRIALSLMMFIVFEVACQVTLKPIIAQEPPKSASETQTQATKEIPTEKPSVTRHTIEFHGKNPNYTATAGYMQMKDETGKLKANIFFVAYVKDGPEDESQRPMTFAFNGGPGAAPIVMYFLQDFIGIVLLPWLRKG